MSNFNRLQKLMKRNNRALVALGVRRYGPVSRAQLQQITGLSLACVCSVVDELLSDGILKEVDSVAGPRGRPVALLSIDPNGTPVAGVWLSEEAIEIAIAGPTTDILARRSVSYDCCDDNPETLADAMVLGIERCSEAAGKDVESLNGIGVVVAGTVNALLGIAEGVANGRGWRDIPIGKLLEDRLGLPVYVEADVRAAAIAAQWLSDDGRDGGVIYMTITDGVGAAIIHNHELIRGTHNMGGLVASMVVDVESPHHKFRGANCVGDLASHTAFICNLWPELENSVDRMTSTERTNLAQRGVELAVRGDHDAVRALADITRYAGMTVANCISLMDPQTVFVLGSFIDAAPDQVIDAIRREAIQHVPRESRGVEIKALTGYKEFLLRGSVGLVLWQSFRIVRDANRSTWSLAHLKG